MKKIMILSALALLAFPSANARGVLAAEAATASDSTYTVYLEDSAKTLGDDPVCYPYASKVTLSDWYIVGSFCNWSKDNSNAIRLIKNETSSSSDKGVLFNVKLEAGWEFKTTNGTNWAGYHGANSTVSSCFSGTEGNNITVKTTGYYTIYSNSSNQVWLDSPVSDAFSWDNGVKGFASETIDGKKVTAFEIDATKYKKASSYLTFSSSADEHKAAVFSTATFTSGINTVTYSSSSVKAGSTKYHTVTYKYLNGSADETVIVKDGATLTPKAVTKESDLFYTYAFDGWYTDAAHEHPFDTTVGVTGDFTLYAKWKETNTADYDKLASYETMATLSYEYNAITTTAEDSTETTSYDISNVAIRFGGVIDATDYEKFSDAVTEFGIVLTVGEKTTTLHCPTTGENAKTPYHDETNGKYIFNAYISVSEEHYADEITAKAYLKYGDVGPTITLFKEKTYSVKSIAQAYIDGTSLTAEQRANTDLMGSLNQLANYTKASE